jgi:hypothetical protein
MAADLTNERKILALGLSAPLLILSMDFCKDNLILSGIDSSKSEGGKSKIWLTNLRNKRIDEIKKDHYVLRYPRFANDCQKFSATGYRLTPEKRMSGGYFVFDMRTKEINQLKEYEQDISGEFQPLIFLMQYRNHSCWKKEG